MQLTKMSSVRHGATDLGQRPPIGPLSVLSVRNRGWLVALVWARAKGESKMIARFGMVLYRCGLVIAFLCGPSGTDDFGGDPYKQADGLGSLDRGGVFCGGRRPFMAGRSRGEECTDRHLKPSAAWSS